MSDRLDFSIEGMTCMHCANRLEGVLRETSGVHSAHVNLAEKAAVIEFDPDAVDAATIARVVRDTGFTPGATRTRMAAKGMHCASSVTQVEEALAKTPGVVSASVNTPTAQADIEYRPALIDVEGLDRAIEESGYELTPAMEATEDSGDRHAAEQDAEYSGLMRKFWFAAIVSVPERAD